jgi:hypothetical protein
LPGGGKETSYRSAVRWNRNSKRGVAKKGEIEIFPRIAPAQLIGSGTLPEPGYRFPPCRKSRRGKVQQRDQRGGSHCASPGGLAASGRDRAVMNKAVRVRRPFQWGLAAWAKGAVRILPRRAGWALRYGTTRRGGAGRSLTPMGSSTPTRLILR